MSFAIKLHLPGGSSVVLRDLDPDITFGLLKQKIGEKAGLEASEVKVMGGFPLQEYDGAWEETVSSLGIEKGSVLTITKAPRPAPQRQVSEAMSSTTATTSSGSATTAADGTVGSEEGVRSLIDMGFPEAMAKRALEITEGDVNSAFELCLSGSILDYQSGSTTPSRPPPTTTTPTTSTSTPSSPTKFKPSGMVRRVIDADNSCLFNAVGYLVERAEKCGTRLRRVIAEAVRARPDLYTEAILGKEREDYCRWIQDESKWGGEIELFILSQHYQVEIVAIEIRSLHCYCYGEGSGFSRRIYLLYDGVHYDSLVREPYPGAQATYDITKFDVDDEVTKRTAVALAAELKQHRQYVDLAAGTLRCSICDKLFKGQEEALAHARVTLHQNFSEA